MEGLIEIKNLADIDHDITTEVAIVFVDSYYSDLRSISNDKEKLVRIFKDSFIPEAIFVALMDGHVAGMLGCSNNQMRAVHIERTTLVKHLGFIRGNIFAPFLEKNFNIPLSYEDDIAYIESVATLSEVRRKGVSTKLVEHVLKKLPYREYRLTVKDNNKNALSIYEKHGFKEIGRIKANFIEKRYFNHKLYMKYEK